MEKWRHASQTTHYGSLLEKDAKAELHTIELLDHAKYALIQLHNQLFLPHLISVLPDQQTTD